MILGAVSKPDKGNLFTLGPIYLLNISKILTLQHPNSRVSLTISNPTKLFLPWPFTVGKNKQTRTNMSVDWKKHVCNTL